MRDIRTALENMRRPRLLMNAARSGLVNYKRDRDLRRLIGTEPRTPMEITLPKLLSEENRLESIRIAGDAAYPVARHIDVMIALLAEARLLPRTVWA
jgi:Family of unknown function (DUF6477)